MKPNIPFDIAAAMAKADALQVVQSVLYAVIRAGGVLPQSTEPGEPAHTFLEVAMEYGKYSYTEESIQCAIDVLAPGFPELTDIFIEGQEN